MAIIVIVTMWLHGYNHTNLGAIAVHKCGHKRNYMLVAMATPVIANVIMLAHINYNYRLKPWSLISAPLAKSCARAIFITPQVMRYRWKDNDEHIVNI